MTTLLQLKIKWGLASTALLAGFLCLGNPGSVDTAFVPDFVSNSKFPNGAGIYTVGLQREGQVIIAGSFDKVGDLPRKSVARLKSDGKVDPEFDPGFGVEGVPLDGMQPGVFSMAVQSDGKVIIGGLFQFVDDWQRDGLARLNQDGGLDIAFAPKLKGSGSVAWVRFVAIQPDGKILVIGQFITIDDMPRFRFARLNSDGSVDLSFNSSNSAILGQGLFHAVAPVGDKLYVGGESISISGISFFGIARLQQTGSFDVSFRADVGDLEGGHTVSSVAVQEDKKIVVCGRFTTVGGIQRNQIARLDVTGNLDMDFNPRVGANQSIQSAVLEKNGKIILWGNFVRMNGIQRNGIARLKTDGSLDESFDPGTGANGMIRGLAIEDDGKIVIWGDFTSYNGTPRNRIARVNSDGQLEEVRLLFPTLDKTGFQFEAATRTDKSYVVEFKNDLLDKSWDVLGSESGNGKIKVFTNLAPSSVQRYYRIRVE